MAAKLLCINMGFCAANHPSHSANHNITINTPCHCMHLEKSQVLLDFSWVPGVLLLAAKPCINVGFCAANHSSNSANHNIIINTPHEKPEDCPYVFLTSQSITTERKAG